MYFYNHYITLYYLYYDSIMKPFKALKCSNMNIECMLNFHIELKYLYHIRITSIGDYFNHILPL